MRDLRFTQAKATIDFIKYYPKGSIYIKMY